MGFSKRLYEEIEQFEQDALNGEINELQAYIELKQFEELIAEKKKNISKAAMRLVELEKDYKAEQSGYIVAKMQKTTWNFKHIAKWVEKKAELSSIEDTAKMAYQLSQKDFGNNTVSDFENNQIESIANASTGEIIEAAIPEYSEPFLKLEKIKLKKEKV
jgi:hypothetical protein